MLLDRFSRLFFAVFLFIFLFFFRLTPEDIPHDVAQRHRAILLVLGLRLVALDALRFADLFDNSLITKRQRNLA